jgi:hypothetical protein
MWYLASILILAFVIHRAIKKGSQESMSTEKAFWERERKANEVRRKSLDALDYILVPLDELPVNILTDKNEVKECVELLRNLSSQRIINLTGYTNTDLKLKYGAANIQYLTEYDQNYTLLVRTLQKWAEMLLEAGYTQESRQIWEYAVQIGTDVSKTYYALANLYRAAGESSQIDGLIQSAQSLRSQSRTFIIKGLKEIAE